MTTTNANAEDAPSLWKKWWNALANCFKRDQNCTCSPEKPATSKVEETKIQEKKAAA